MITAFSTTISVREKTLPVWVEINSEPDVNFFGIDWSFDGLSREQEIALDITNEEVREIEEQILEAYNN